MPKKIALVSCSTRNPRLNPFIAQYIQNILTPHLPPTHTLEIIDLADQHLPLYDEPAIPSKLPAENPTPHYVHDHTKAWSARVSQYDAFIFVTPQYNWSIPASLKNALDYLYYEWKGKAAGIVSFGGRGGGKATDHLRGVLSGLRMRIAETSPGLVINGQMLDDCLSNGEVKAEDRERWEKAGVTGEIHKMFAEVVAEIDGV